MRNEVVLCLLLVGGAARANDAEAARELAQRGTEAYRQGRFHDAKQAYAHAYDLDPRPPLLFDIAQCARAEHDFAGAASFYRLYLEAYPKHEAPNDAMVRDLLAEMEAQRSDAGSPMAAQQPSPAHAPIAAKPPPSLTPRVEVPPPLIAASTPLPPRAPEEPLYKKWWVWAGAAAVATGIVVAAVAVNEPQPRGASLGAINLRGGR
jgi:tetratricopeptide (TPR) repeat protein